MRTTRLAPILFAAAAFTCAELAATARAADPPRTRPQFARAISELTVGMPEKDVLRQLGRPDDVRTEHDPGGISTVGTKEIWRYGTSGHLTTATLGQIYIDKNDQVQYVFGKGTPPPKGMFEEKNLRVVLDALGEVPSYNAGWRYNPREVIRAVNLLQPLGKEKSLAAIDEFLRVASHFHDSGREGVFLVLRTLFDVPADPGYMPPMLVGAPTPAEPDGHSLLPRFPIAIEGDIPFLLVEGYSLAGFPEQPESHVAYFRKHGQVRAKPLAPSDRPFVELETLARSPHDENRRKFFGEQLLRLADTVYRVEPEERTGELLPFGDKDAAKRNRIIEEATALRIRWDANAQQYTFLNGISLPKPPRRYYRREIWRPAVAGLDAELTLERLGPHYVSLSLVEKYQVGKADPVGVFRVFDVTAKGKPLAELATAGGKWAGGEAPSGISNGTVATSISGKYFRLNEGGQVQVELTVDKRPQLSPTFRP